MNIKPCPNCKTEMLYDTWYHCFECTTCSKTWNGALQELQPKRNWQAEYDAEDY